MGRFNKSIDMIKKALDVIPNGTQTYGKCYNQWVFGASPIFIKKAKGCIITDIDGNNFIDMVAALGPIIFGYQDGDVDKAIAEQLRNGIIFSLCSPLEVELAELIKNTVPCAEMVKFAKNGSDVCSLAARLTRYHTKRNKILLMRGHYHGWSDFFAAAAGRNSGIPAKFEGDFEKIEYNNEEQLEEKLKTKEFASVIMEPVSLEAPKAGYLNFVRECCSKYGTLLVFDEVVTGYRWSIGGAQKYFNVIPDIAMLGKAIANGMPLSVLAGRREFMSSCDNVFFGGTNFGEALCLAAAVATIKKMKKYENDIYNHIWNSGFMIEREFNEHCNLIGLNAKMIGMAPRHNLVFKEEDASGCKDLFQQEMIRRSVFWGTQIYITVSHKEKHLKRVIECIKESLDVVRCAVEEKNIDKYLDGNRSKVFSARS